MQTCTDCNGLGYIQEAGKGVSGFHRCVTCGGRGVIESYSGEERELTVKAIEDEIAEDDAYENRTKAEIWADTEIES